MLTEQAINVLEQNAESKSTLKVSFKHGEIISILNGLIEIEVDLEYHSNRVLMKFKAPKFVKIFRIKKREVA